MAVGNRAQMRDQNGDDQGMAIKTNLRETDGSIAWNLLRWSATALALCLALGTLAGCDVERRKSDAELGLTPQQATGRKIYDNYCDRCHDPYSSRGKKGPSLKGVFKKQYLPLSGLPANDERVTDIIRFGRAKMEGFDRVMNERQIKDLLAYLHTL